jgi:lipid-A-disaccharide synthase
MKYYVIAGEASGDLHASNLMREINRLDDAEWRCWGGDLMEAQGGHLVKHYKDLAFMGFWEVATHLRIILRNIKICKKDILAYRPDILVLVDYPGFNLRIAEWAKQQGFKVVYYISPQIWAWKTGRVHKIKRVCDHVMPILPFEKQFYAKYGYHADYVGHPLLDAIPEDISDSPAVRDFRKVNGLDGRPIIAILPGSRRQEILRILPVMLRVVEHYPDYQFVVSTVKWLPEKLYADILRGYDVKCVLSQTYPLVLNAEAALVTSGTATLETGILGTRQVVCYKTSGLSYRIARAVAKDTIRFISLVNLILDRPAVTELIQHDLTVDKLRHELDLLLYDEATRRRISADYAELVQRLGGRGASARAAQIVLDCAKNGTSNCIP